jgi:aminopeptidase N
VRNALPPAVPAVARRGRGPSNAGMLFRTQDRPRARPALPTLLALLLVCAAPAQRPEPAGPRNVSGGVLIAEQGCFDVQHYDLTLAVDPKAQTIEGTLAMAALATGDCARIALDLDAALTTRAVRVDGKATRFEHRDGRIWIEPSPPPAAGASFTVAVDYGGEPREARRPPWDGGFTWQETKAGLPWIATSCQGEGADLWWPCKDHPSDKPAGFDLRITVPDDLVVAANGTLQGKPKSERGRRTYHWQVRSPISNYCVALNIAPYEVVEDTYTCVDGTKMPVQFFCLPENEAKAKRILPQFLDHLRCFEELLGPYPFRHEKYGIAETPHLGMEHQTIIAYGNGYRDMRYDWLHNHELSHEWWGNLVTCRDWKDMWIHEGFGTYMQPLYKERRQGRKAYEIELRKNVRSLTNLRPVAPREATDSHAIYFGAGGSNDIYFKGAWVLHTLRWQLGDDKFFTCLRRFCYPTAGAAKATDGTQCRLVDTEDFVRLVNEIAGEDLGWFFEVYVRQPKLPELAVEEQGGVLKLRWQVPDGLKFELPAPVKVGDEVRRVPMPGGVGECKVGSAKHEIDPDWLVLMKR